MISVSNANDKSVRIVISLSLAAITFLVYWQVLDHGFLNFDDNRYVSENTHVTEGLTRDGLTWAFTESYASNWHPMAFLSHMLDVELYGLDPSGHHLTSLLFHIANSLLLFGVLLKMTGALWRSGLVAVLFALHPLNVESVAWIAERKNVLSTFFWFLTLWAYVDYVNKKKSYWLVVLFLALGLMAKPMLVTLPFALLLLDFWPLHRCKGWEAVMPLIIEKFPLFLLALAVGVITYSVQKSGGAMGNPELHSFYTGIANALVSYVEYLEKIIWPRGLSILYPHPGDAVSTWKALTSGLVLIGISVGVVRILRRAPYLAVGWFWFLGTLVPVIGIVQVGDQAMSDRYMYIPSMGLFIAIVWGLSELMAKWRLGNRVLVILAGLMIPVLMLMTWTQVGHWTNSVTIFQHAIEVTDKKYPNFAIAYTNLGQALIAEGKNGEAMAQYKKAIQLMPGLVKAHYNLGHALITEGKNEEGISHYRIAIKHKPDYLAAHYNLGHALIADGKNTEAIAQFRRVIELQPALAEGHNNLGYALLMDRKVDEAISQYKKAIQLKPDYALARQNLESALSQSEEKKILPSSHGTESGESLIAPN